MRVSALITTLLIAVAWAASASEQATTQAATDNPFVRRLDFPAMGQVVVHTPEPDTVDPDIVLLASGDGGWNAVMNDIAARLRSTGKIVIGFSTPEYLRRADAADTACTNAAGDLLALSQFVERQLGVRTYRTPLLVGYASGASLAYVIAAQAPVNALAGAIAIGFCPTLDLDQMLCRRGALRHAQIKDADGLLHPVSRLVAPLEAVTGPNDGRCQTGGDVSFMQQVGNAHSSGTQSSQQAVLDAWLERFFVAYDALVAKREAARAPKVAVLTGLPLIERPVETSSTTLIVMLSGDGGWSTLTERVTDELNANGSPVVGWNMLKYFWTAKTPQRAGDDLAAIMRYFSDAWHMPNVILAGYSMGADVLPAMVNRLPVAQQRQIRSVILMAPGRATDFEFHIGGWLQHVPRNAQPIAPEVANLPAEIRLTCIYGLDDAARSLCTQIDPARSGLTLEALPGAHHFDGDYAALARLVR